MVFKKFQANVWTYEKANDEIIGVLESIKPNTSFKDKLIYQLKKEDGSISTVFGTTVLDDKMVGIKVGDLIKIVYLGTKEGKKGQNATKLFDVFKDEPEKT